MEFSMNPDKIQLSSIEKSLTYETISRDLDKMDRETLITFSKCYVKLFLKQQETLSCLTPLDNLIA